MNLGVELANKFMRGELERFSGPVEDSEPFIALSSAYSARNAAIESAVMELAHGSCHVLTLALSDALCLASVLVIRDAVGMPIHSGLHNGQRGLILDANGVHGIDDSLSFWSGIVGAQCSAAEMSVDDLHSFCTFDEDEATMALEDFALIADFIQAEIIGKPCL